MSWVLQLFLQPGLVVGSSACSKGSLCPFQSQSGELEQFQGARELSLNKASSPSSAGKRINLAAVS